MRHGVRGVAVGLVVVATAVCAPALPASAKPAKGGGGAPSPGYDIGYPQCGRPFPGGAAFGVVGVNDGLPYSTNPCLGTGSGPSELSWAEAAANHAPAFYANTADPGAAVSAHWPLGQSVPFPCTADAPDSTACSYDYGWNAATDSFDNAVAAERQVHGPAYDGVKAASTATWWLDVETANSWESLETQYGQTPTAQENDTQALLGAVAALHGLGASTVGIYSTALQWTQITGGPAVTGTRFATNANWLAGNSNASGAQSRCGSVGFTGGPVKLAQYPQGSYDADIACP